MIELLFLLVCLGTVIYAAAATLLDHIESKAELQADIQELLEDD